MSNIDNPNENKELDGALLGPTNVEEGHGFDDETLADYLARTGTPATREVSLFAGWKKPKRSKPTFTFPRVPSLF